MRTGRHLQASVRALSLALAGSLLGACASAGLLASSPLDPGDRRLMEQATQEALDKNKVGESANWRNPETGHLGTVTPLRTDPSGAQPCRDYQATFTIEGRTAFTLDSACRLPDGKWRSNSYPGLAGSRFEERPQGYPHPYGDPYYHPPYHEPRFGFGFGYHHYRWR